jgi:hypothetical protein
LHPLDFIKRFPLLHFWFPHLHTFPSAIALLINYDYWKCLRDIGTEGVLPIVRYRQSL